MNRDGGGASVSGDSVKMFTQSKPSASQIRKNRKHIGLPKVQVYYKVHDLEGPRLMGWITEVELKEIKLLREKTGSPPLRILQRASTS